MFLLPSRNKIKILEIYLVVKYLLISYFMPGLVLEGCYILGRRF